MNTSKGRTMLPIILIYGLIGGVIVGAPMVWGMLTFDPSNGSMPENGAIIGYATCWSRSPACSSA
jgi:hypothetical protein